MQKSKREFVCAEEILSPSRVILKSKIIPSPSLDLKKDGKQSTYDFFGVHQGNIAVGIHRILSFYQNYWGGYPVWYTGYKNFTDLPRVHIPEKDWISVRLRIENTDEILVWIIEHLSGLWYSPRTGEYFFEKGDDAVLFKMTWFPSK